MNVHKRTLCLPCSTSIILCNRGSHFMIVSRVEFLLELKLNTIAQRKKNFIRLLSLPSLLLAAGMNSGYKALPLKFPVYCLPLLSSSHVASHPFLVHIRIEIVLILVCVCPCWHVNLNHKMNTSKQIKFNIYTATEIHCYLHIIKSSNFENWLDIS